MYHVLSLRMSTGSLTSSLVFTHIRNAKSASLSLTEMLKCAFMEGATRPGAGAGAGTGAVVTGTCLLGPAVSAEGDGLTIWRASSLLSFSEAIISDILLAISLNWSFTWFL